MDGKSLRERALTIYVLGTVGFFVLAVVSDGRQRWIALMWLLLLAIGLRQELRQIRRQEHEYEQKYGHDDTQ